MDDLSNVAAGLQKVVSGKLRPFRLCNSTGVVAKLTS
jgi:hypothetical protein